MSLTIYDTLEYAGLRLLDIIAFVLSNIIVATGYAFVNYPNASTLVLSVLTLYIFYKMIRRIVRFWLNMMVAMIKFTVIMLFLAVLAAVYVRGFNRFFTKDIYFLKELFTSQAEASDFLFKQYAYNLMDDDRFEFLHGARDFFEGSSFLIDDSYEYGETYDQFKNVLNDAIGEDGFQQLNALFNNRNH